jgi:hypothetical protein
MLARVADSIDLAWPIGIERGKQGLDFLQLLPAYGDELEALSQRRFRLRLATKTLAS